MDNTYAMTGHYKLTDHEEKLYVIKNTKLRLLEEISNIIIKPNQPVCLEFDETHVKDYCYPASGKYTISAKIKTVETIDLKRPNNIMPEAVAKVNVFDRCGRWLKKKLRRIL